MIFLHADLFEAEYDSNANQETNSNRFIITINSSKYYHHVLIRLFIFKINLRSLISTARWRFNRYTDIVQKIYILNLLVENSLIQKLWNFMNSRKKVTWEKYQRRPVPWYISK